MESEAGQATDGHKNGTGTPDSLSFDRQERLVAERRLGIGGSDATHYLEIKPYGCPRKAWYQRSDIPPDYPGDLLPNQHMREGTDLETPIAEEWSRRTGRPVIERQDAIFHPTIPGLLVHLDREILPVLEYDGPGVLEIKSLAPYSWEQFEREGLFAGYVWQMQHALLVTGYRWGAFAIHRRLEDNPETRRSRSFDLPMGRQDIHTWDVFPDSDMQARILNRAGWLWRCVEENTPPDLLPPGSKPCRDCAWREHCQGRAAVGRVSAGRREFDDDPELRRLQDEYRSAMAARREADRRAKELKSRIDSIIGVRREVVTPDGRAERVLRVRRRLDTKALLAAHPELAEKFTVESTRESLKVR